MAGYIATAIGCMSLGATIGFLIAGLMRAAKTPPMYGGPND